MQIGSKNLPVVALLFAAILGYLNTRYAGYIPAPVTGLWKNTVMFFILGISFSFVYPKYWWMFALSLISITLLEYAYWVFKWFFGAGELIVGLLLVYAMYMLTSVVLGSFLGSQLRRAADRLKDKTNSE